MAADGQGLRHLAFDNGSVRPGPNWERCDEPFAKLIGQLEDYFQGRPVRFTVEPRPEGTDFRRRIWSALQEVPHGSTLSYAELAERAGRRGAARATGGAVGANPISIVIPCHRIVGADGSLTGFGGGLKRKKFLLELEGISL